MTEILMTKMGDAMEEGLLTRWLKHDGDPVKEGESIAEVQTDKANVELTAPKSGKLGGIQVKEGESVPVNAVIAYILREGELPPPPIPTRRQPPSATPAPASNSDPALLTPSEATPVDGNRVKVSPLARKLAAERGIDLSKIRGSGPGGRIVERDLESFPGSRYGTATLSRTSAPIASPSLPTSATVGEPVEISRMRKLIGQRTVISKQTVPHFYVTSEVDMDTLLAMREQFNDGAETKLSINDFVLKACAVALTLHPNVNMMYQDDRLVPLTNVNIGVMVAIPDGLVVPVVKQCEMKSLRRIGADVRAFVEKAKAGTLQPDEMSGSSFSVSNLGMFDVENFAAIINVPNSAILAVGSSRRVPVVMPDDTIQPRSRMKMTLSADHRVVDGASAAVFLREIKTLLENPIRLVE